MNKNITLNWGGVPEKENSGKEEIPNPNAIKRNTPPTLKAAKITISAVYSTFLSVTAKT